MSDPICLAVDTGGTFTDYVVLDEAGEVQFGKVPSTPSEPSRSLGRVLRDHSLPPDGLLLHGSTVATNTLLEDRLAPVTLVTNRGLEGLLRVGRGTREELYGLNPDPRDTDVFRDVPVEGAPLRQHPRGSGFEELGEDAGRRLRECVRRHGSDVVAVCLVHSYREPAAELDVERALAPLDATVVLSSDVHPRFREFERASTTLVNAGLRPRMDRYHRRVGRLEGAPDRMLVMSSSRGVMPPELLEERPVLSLMSGPAAGLLGARSLVRPHTDRPLLTMDVGGTSTDVSVVEGRPPLRKDHRIGGYPVGEPMVDVHTVGSGGGSSLWIDRGGHLRVGPRSAGAHPGPACYGHGGPPTVTDAQIFLGRIPDDRPLSSQVTLDGDAASRALQGLAEELGSSPREVARGALRIARSRLSEALRSVTVNRGHEPGECALVAYGGAGGLYAVPLARDLGIRSVFVPRRAGVTSARGLLDAPELRQRSVSPVSVLGTDERLPGLDGLLERGPDWGPPLLEADCRFAGQNHELSVELEPGVSSGRLRDRFVEQYRRVYGYRPGVEEVELVTLNAYWTRELDVTLPDRSTPTSDTALDYRPVDLGSGPREIPFYRLESLRDPIDGPAVLTGSTTTLYLPGDARLAVRSPDVVEVRTS